MSRRPHPSTDGASDYPPLEALSVSSNPTLPYFGLQQDAPTGQSRENELLYGDPATLYPGTSLDDSPALSEANNDDDEREVPTVDVEESDVEGIPHAGLASLDANKRGIDDDFTLAEDESDSDSDSGSDSEADSEDRRITTALRELEEAKTNRGRGRGRGLSRGQRGGRGRGRGAQIAALIRRVDGDEGRPAGRGRPRRGEGRKARRRKKNGTGTMAEPSQEFKQSQAKATTAFLGGDYDAAEEHVREAIRINPEIFAAHSLLSQIYLEQGKKDESVAVLWSGAHTKREKGVWWEVANRTSELSAQDDPTTPEQLLYCYSQILKLDPKDIEARRGKLTIWVAQGQVGKAIRECHGILKTSPHDLDVLQQLARLAITQRDAGRAKKAYDPAIKYYQTIEPSGRDSEFSLSDLNIYLELLLHEKEYELGLSTLKSISRWLLGRKDENCWDNWVADDCEWDVKDTPRRIKVPGFQPGRYDIETYGDSLPPELRAKLGIFRLKLGSSHIAEAMHHFEYFSPQHTIDAGDVYEYPDLFSDIANALHDSGQHEQATIFFKAVIETRTYLTIDVWLKAAASSKFMGQLETAARCYEKAATQEPNNVRHKISLIELYDMLGSVQLAEKQAADIIRLGDRDSIREARLKASRNVDWGPAELRLRAEPVKETLDQVSEVNLGDEGEEEQETTVGGAESLPKKEKRKPRKPAKYPRRAPTTHRKPKRSFPNEETQKSSQLLRDYYNKAYSLRPSMQDGDMKATDEWMDTIEHLIDRFAKEPLFYDKGYMRFCGYNTEERKRARMSAPEIEEIQAAAKRSLGTGDLSIIDDLDNIPNEYCGITFHDWLELFCEYAFLCAQRQDLTECYRVLTLAETANVFTQSTEFISQVKITVFTCALLLSDEEKLVNVSREFIRKYPGSTYSYRLYAALTRLFNGKASWYNSGPSQKFLMRQVKALDFALLDEINRKWYTFTAQERISFTLWAKDAKSNTNLIEHDPVLLTLYAHILATAGSFHNALNYYIRAYAFAPDDSCLNLSMALAYAQLALKRQHENRHYAILQGLAFLKRYSDVRMSLIGHDRPDQREKAILQQEIAFNEARFSHMLGLSHLAVEGYERCLDIKLPEEDILNGSLRNGTMNSAIGHDSEGDATMTEQNSGYQNAETRIESDSGTPLEPDFHREAAFALQQIIATGGDTKRAREITERWLVF